MPTAPQSLVQFLSASDNLAAADVYELCQQIPLASDEEMAWFFAQLAQLSASAPVADHVWETVLGSCEAWLRRRRAVRGGEPLPPALREQLEATYAALGPQHAARYHLLSILTIGGQPAELESFCRLITTDPPATLAASTAPFFPLLEPEVAVQPLFPALLEGLAHEQVAVAVLDLANRFTRDGRCQPHPASGRQPQLIQLLVRLTHQLERLQRAALAGTDPQPQRREQVETGIALALALCDALGLMGAAEASGPLTDLVQLQHRRLRAEAAAALTRLGDAAGKQTLLELASEPSVRLRVMAYAEELEIESEIDEAYRSPEAVAEAELVTYLAQPTMMGVPPTTCELVDARTLYWPGYEEPRNCYLFRFTYQTIEADGAPCPFTNFGITGPLVHAFPQPIDHLPVESAYAMFAGWQAEHEDILEFDVDPQSLHPVLADYLDRLQQADYESLQPVVHGKFFGDETLVASCQKQQQPGTAVVDAYSIEFFPGLEPGAAYCNYKGRRLLRAFNESF